ncbi:MAG: nucleotide exchange factor GrpE [Sphingobacteriales bacterium]|nr:nucleotide exchange factor GrpE [Sphingobacteriales bacterium]
MKEKKQNPAEETNGQALEAEQPAMDMGINADENMAGTTHLNDAVATEDELGKLQTQLAEQKDKYIRLLAEFDNYKRRNAKERIELIQTAGKDVIVSLLDVLDDCDRAEKVMQSSEDVAVIKEGIQLVFNKLRSNMQSKGLKAMESINQDFDVEKHEAITQISAPTEALKGKVLDEIVKGYYLNDKLIRFAKVVVGN